MQTKILTPSQKWFLWIFIFMMIQWAKFFQVFFLEYYYKGFFDSINVANPWITTGTAWNNPSIIAPYSVMWFMFYNLIAGMQLHNYGILLINIWIIDTIFVITVYRFQSHLYTLIFSICSYFLITISPGDILILWIAVLGKERPWMGIFAAITKLPFPAPLPVWEYIFTSNSLGCAWLCGISNSLVYLGLWRYIMLGIYIIHPLFYRQNWNLRRWFYGR